MTKKAGRPRKYAEGKKQTGVWLTDEAVNSFKAFAASHNTSVSEIIEQVGRLEESRLRLMLSDRPVVAVDLVADLLVGFAQAAERGELDSGLIWECHDKLIKQIGK